MRRGSPQVVQSADVWRKDILCYYSVTMHVDICGYSPSFWAARTSWCHKEWGIMRQQMDTIAKGLGQVITATWRGSLVLQLSKVPSWWQRLWLFIGQYIFMNTWLIFIDCSHSVWRSSWPWGCPPVFQILDSLNHLSLTTQPLLQMNLFFCPVLKLSPNSSQPWRRTHKTPCYSILITYSCFIWASPVAQW